MATYLFSVVVGINLEATSRIAYWVWYSNSAIDFFIGIFTVHIFVLATDGFGYFKNVLKIMYTTGILIVVTAIIFPTAFLVKVSPVGYYLSYTNSSGPLYFLVDGYFLLCFALSYYILFFERRLKDRETKMRIDYYIAGITFGLVTGLTSLAPDFNLPIDPGISAAMGMFTIPLVYGMIKKGLMNIRIVIRKAVLITSFIVFY